MNLIVRLGNWLNPKVMMLVWLILALIWTVLLIPSLAFWYESLKWLVVMSWWANVAASMACFVAALSDRDSEQLRKDVAEIKERLNDLPFH